MKTISSIIIIIIGIVFFNPTGVFKEEDKIQNFLKSEKESYEYNIPYKIKRIKIQNKILMYEIDVLKTETEILIKT